MLRNHLADDQCPAELAHDKRRKGTQMEHFGKISIQ